MAGGDRREVQVQGLRKLRRALNEIDRELTKELRDDFKEIGKIVAADARQRVPERKGRARKSIRVLASGSNTYIAGGRKSVPYYGWLDFGSRTPKRGQPRSVGPWANTGPGPKRGRFIYSAIDANREMIERRALGAMEIARERSFRDSDDDLL